MGHLSPPFSSLTMRSGWKTNGECTSPEPQRQPWAPPAPLSCSLWFIQSQTKPEESICQLNLDLHLRLHLSAPAAALDTAVPSLLQGDVNSENVFFYPVWLLLTVLTAGTEVPCVQQGLIWALVQPWWFSMLRIIPCSPDVWNPALPQWPARNSSPGMAPAAAPGWTGCSCPLLTSSSLQQNPPVMF